MPVTRDIGAELAQTLIDLYRGLETKLAADMARDLARGIDSPDWAENKLSALALIRRRTETLLSRISAQLDDRVTQALILAYYQGAIEGLREMTRQQRTTLERLAIGNPLLDRLSKLATKRGEALRREMNRLRSEVPGLDAIQRLAFTLTSKLRGTHTLILRHQLDVYREVVAQSSLADVLVGSKSRIRAAQVTWERFLGRGITGFVDRAGRRWELASYVEMATRTGTAQAAVEGHVDRLADAGIDLVIVSNAPQECRLCRPWGGKILARAGNPGRIRVQHATKDRMFTIDVVDTVSGAVRDGLLHPNCRHSLSAYLPGVTESPTHTQDPQGDADRQRLRELERRLRKAKLEEDALIDPGMRAVKRKRIRALQAQIRTHVKDTTAKRQRPREQIGVAR